MSQKKYNKEPFESTGANSDTSANIYMSMLMSAAWAELTAKQRVLYMYCKAQFYAEKKKPDTYKSFTMNRSKWQDLYGIYKKNDEKSFYRDMAALIEKGFIVCVECGAVTRTKSIYAFSDMWQRFGTSEFSIPQNNLTMHMRNNKKKV